MSRYRAFTIEGDELDESWDEYEPAEQWVRAQDGKHEEYYVLDTQDDVTFWVEDGKLRTQQNTAS